MSNHLWLVEGLQSRCWSFIACRRSMIKVLVIMFTSCLAVWTLARRMPEIEIEMENV